MTRKGSSTRCDQRFVFQKITVTVKKQSKATDYWRETLTADSKRIFAGKNWSIKYKDASLSFNGNVILVESPEKSFECVANHSISNQIELDDFYHYIESRYNRKKRAVGGEGSGEAQPWQHEQDHHAHHRHTSRNQKLTKRLASASKMYDDSAYSQSRLSKRLKPINDQREIEPRRNLQLELENIPAITKTEESSHISQPVTPEKLSTVKATNLNDFFAFSASSGVTKITPERVKESPKINVEPLTVWEPSGLANLGNTCYLNSALQCLFNLKSFMTNLSARSSLAECLRDVYESSSKAKAFFQILGKKSAKYQGNDQKDCHECFVDILDILESEDKEENDIDTCKAVDLFSSEVTSCLTCDNCGLKRSKKEHYNHFSLDLSSNLSESLDQFFHSGAKLEISCDKCKHKTSTQAVSLSRTPQILLLQLKRFAYSYSKRDSNKNTAPISIPPQLNFGNSSMKLSSVVHHIGKTANSGHYTADLLCNGTSVSGQKKWWRCDDSKVERVNQGDVLDEKNEGVYLLIYERA
eukprot:CAMPEP_0116037750 /NCGR_PEP_ID=MMETSP0321-20121206/22267_1 /TAXON_ID=163516 /ORGANISM="Leptocylindrus danicus var. danicus, Strain B650" /LENGTH=526 /DNA_ID=CAMNT_0003516069 /DNA_START=8 /DNA_END=1588 /DNA_ORIENTATION=+